MRRAWLALALLSGCTDRALGRDPMASDASVVTDAATRSDLALPDLAYAFDGPKRHLAEPCTHDVECLSGDCVTPEETRGEFDNICSATCDAKHPCLEGTCLSFDFVRYWCLPVCEATKQNADCPPGFVCCASGGDIQTCVSPTAQTCDPL